MNTSQKDELLLSLRPVIDLDVSENKYVHFQNHTLRQVLKMQNTIILNICKNTFKTKYKDFGDRDLNIKITLVEKALKSDQNLKQLLFGVVAGHFTSDELDFYLENKYEVNKRLSSLITQRGKKPNLILNLR